MVLLESDTFLSELTRMFQKSRSSGSGTVRITMKKYDGVDRPEPKERKPTKSKSKKKKALYKPETSTTSTSKQNTPSEPSCLMRATLGSRKISTRISSKEVTKFQMAYSSVLRGNMDALKKIKKVKTTTTPASTNSKPS